LIPFGVLGPSRTFVTFFERQDEDACNPSSFVFQSL